MAQILLWGNYVSYQLFQFCNFRETTSVFTRPDYLTIGYDLKDATTTGSK